MSEPPSNSTQLNDINGSALSGTFYGDTILNSAPDVDVKELAQALIEEYGPRHASIAASIGNGQRLVELETLLAKRFSREDAERMQRQAETDAKWALNERRLERIEAATSRSLWASAAALLAAAASWIRGR